MLEEFVLTHFVKGKAKKRVVLSRLDLKQVTEVLRYAAARDSVPKWRTHYAKLNKVLWEVLR